ncbi:MAG: HD domain-containing protein [Firmicutes bacterium]|nr:HD domain-containing protein [Bacillota bacterium]
MNLFKEYVRGYDFNNAKIARKYSHTLRVKILCELIAKNIGLNEQQVALAGKCGLYHDIARFEQAKRFNSFDDLFTVDHGDLGYEIFMKEFAEKLKLSQKETQIIAKSILYHNKLKVSDVNEEELLFTNIVRDADKIDILYQFAFVPGMIKDGEGEIKPKIHDEFIAHKPISRTDITSKRESNILSLAFIWDINFASSYKIIKENHYFDYIQKILNNSIYDEYFDVIRNYLKEK